MSGAEAAGVESVLEQLEREITRLESNVIYLSQDQHARVASLAQRLFVYVLHVQGSPIGGTPRPGGGGSLQSPNTTSRTPSVVSATCPNPACRTTLTITLS